ncbi:MAG TPA: sigma-70 family RNA polymerase sigma factor [Vicinamibacterales bacterium]|nr:sigma-70 family RNA polymerase sigma factor [Vicinamibacterales bacterium]
MATDDLPGSSEAPDLTADLLQRARGGDRDALEELFARHTPLLRRWAAGRLPQWARDAVDTVDLVQETMMGTFRNLDAFELRGEGALQAYLRQAFVNRIRTRLRDIAARPPVVALDSGILDDGTSPLETAIGAETLERYEAALARLDPDIRAAVVSRVELRLSYAEIAELLDKPSADAARMAVARALVRLAEEM